MWKKVHLRSEAACRPLCEKQRKKAPQTMDEEIQWKIGRSRGAKKRQELQVHSLGERAKKCVHSFMHVSSLPQGHGDRKPFRKRLFR